MISGSVIVEGRVLRAGDFHHAEADSDHGEAWTAEGVELLLVASASGYRQLAAGKPLEPQRGAAAAVLTFDSTSR